MMANELPVDDIDAVAMSPESEISAFSQEIEFEQTPGLPEQDKLIHKPKQVEIKPMPAHPFEFAVAACKYKSVHTHCRFDTPRGVENGVCLQQHNGQLACFPDRPPPPPPRHRPRRQF